MTYKIGTRVKKVRMHYRVNEIVPVGATGVIVSTGSKPQWTQAWDCEVRYDGYGMAAALFDCIERILPDGHRAGEEGLCKPLDHLLSRLKGVEA